MPYAGEFIGLITVLCWTLSVQFFESASKKVGSTPVNIIRIGTALVCFSILLFIRTGDILPFDFPKRAWIYLSLSGMIGFFLGDIFLFKAFVEIGPRLAMLIMSLSAPVAAVTGWLFIDESYLLFQWTGMAVTLSGVCIVILEKNNSPNPNKRKSRQISLKGVLFGIGGMLGQSFGYILSKTGMQTETGYLDAFAATQIRAIAAFLCFFLFFTITKRWKSVGQAIKNISATSTTIAGSILGPFLGVSLSLLTLHYLTVGVASTIFSLVPVCIIPFSIFIHKEHISARAIIGALIAVSGVWLLSN
ncbi:MAG: DMT family transporter [Desulfobacteraceae bacterium]|nr:DMT family transporter [Desulfobacteraceae bacterium]